MGVMRLVCFNKVSVHLENKKQLIVHTHKFIGPISVSIVCGLQRYIILKPSMFKASAASNKGILQRHPPYKKIIKLPLYKT